MFLKGPRFHGLQPFPRILPGALTLGDPASLQGETIISREGEIVNRQTREPNFTMEAPESFMPAPERTQEQRTVLEEIGYDETGKTTPEESEAMSFIKDGAAPREEGLALMEAQDAETMRKNIENAGYNIMGCVMEVIE